MSDLADVTLEVASQDGQVVLTFSADGGPGCPLWMEPDEARDLCNGLGAAIKATTGVTA